MSISISRSGHASAREHPLPIRFLPHAGRVSIIYAASFPASDFLAVSGCIKCATPLMGSVPSSPNKWRRSGLQVSGAAGFESDLQDLENAPLLSGASKRSAIICASGVILHISRNANLAVDPVEVSVFSLIASLGYLFRKSREITGISRDSIVGAQNQVKNTHHTGVAPIAEYRLENHLLLN
ncbi:hypothetical protein [Burkholderia sp. Bp9031]|uniref:hypothetical protein n=1 Tax=Burkholderia sp. Bp9031 TaxID=2184566 RepID=UPI000A9E7170|nr:MULTISPECIES: hypothetical protein [Burkholderia]